ncbi:type IV toxin-antitoxin system AbiEi family antitoxin domain-containing protein [Nocardioides sp. MAHUQ-72]|uniref:hypothetical protein n=1 Tax=unclassified Nocardioides TaxID=2615069 RepID=UPI00361C4F09
MELEPTPGTRGGPAAPVPVDRPFTRAQVVRDGVTDRQLAAWCSSGDLVNPLQGVYHASQLPDGLDLRIGCLKLVVPDDAVITDRTAGWLHGAPMILAPNDHLAVPPVSMFRPPGYRLRNELAASGERTFAAGEVVDLDGLRVTSKLRTTCDLGMMRGRDQAFAAMGAMMAVAGDEFGIAELVDQGDRFRGYRRVRQFRQLAPMVDPRPQSPPEHILLLRWLDCPSLPVVTPQLQVVGPEGHFYLDLGVEGLGYGAEYDGDRWHGPEQQRHDRARRGWLAEHGEWLIDVFVDRHLFGSVQAVERRLYAGVAEAKRRLGRRAWRGQDRGPDRARFW